MKDIFLDWRGVKTANFQCTIPVPEQTCERAAHTVYGAASDFVIAIGEAQTPSEAIRLARMLAPLIEVLETAQKKALDRADALQGVGHV